jgi:hypothetical protein
MARSGLASLPVKARGRPYATTRIGKSARAFKGIICDDISEFESYMPSHAVWSLWAMSGLRNYANISPMNVAMALMSPAERRLSMVRSICASRATATAALTVPQTDARNACSKLNVARTSPRAITRKHASHAVNKGAATKAAPPARVDGLAPLRLTVHPRGRNGRPSFWERPSPRAARPERSLPRE